MANGIYTILLLILSNVFMTFAWYGHLRLQQTGVSAHWPLFLVISFSWMIAFFEYCCQVSANRLGFVENGGPFNLVQLKVIQECISLVVFAVVANFLSSTSSSTGIMRQRLYAWSQRCILYLWSHSTPPLTSPLKGRGVQ